MKQLVEWVRTILDRPQDPVVDEQSSEPVSVEDLVTPNIYAEVKTTTKTLDLSSPDSNKTRGFNPYDTARLHKK